MEDTTAKRQLAISMRVLKETILSKPLKKVQILAEWLAKYGGSHVGPPSNRYCSGRCVL